MAKMTRKQSDEHIFDARKFYVFGKSESDRKYQGNEEKGNNG
jgi:hypothetical protein